jgi:hypothetical protein
MLNTYNKSIMTLNTRMLRVVDTECRKYGYNAVCHYAEYLFTKCHYTDYWEVQSLAKLLHLIHFITIFLADFYNFYKKLIQIWSRLTV